MLNKLILICAFSMVTICASTAESDDPDRIEMHSYEYYQINRSQEISDTCKTDEMLAYGLSTDATSLGDKNEICPQIKKNCCGKRDQAKLWQYWHRDRKPQQNFHRSVLLMLKYIIGYGKEWYNIANAIIIDYKDKELAGKQSGQSTNQTNPSATIDDIRKQNPRIKNISVNATGYCHKAAKFIIKLNYNTKEKVESFYADISRKTEFMENARRSFYCMLCSVEGQASIKTVRYKPNYSTVNYTMDFCNTIIRQSFTVTYLMYNTYNRYIKNVLRMSTCLNNTEQSSGTNTNASGSSGDFRSKRPPSQLSIADRKLFHNPLRYNDFLKMEACYISKGYLNNVFCTIYCSAFNIAKPHRLLDGEIDALLQVYNRLTKLESTFPAPQINIFRDNMVKMKATIALNIQKVDISGLFYKSQISYIDIATYNQFYILGWDSVDPMLVAKGTPLPMNYKFSKIASATVLGLVFCLFYRG